MASRPEPSWRRERADLRQRDRRRDDDDANGTAAPVKGAGDANIVVECTSEYEEYGPAEGRGRPCARKLVDDEMVATRCARWSRQSSPDIYCAFFFCPSPLLPPPPPNSFASSFSSSYSYTTTASCQVLRVPFLFDSLRSGFSFVCVRACVCVCVCVLTAMLRLRGYRRRRLSWHLAEWPRARCLLLQ